MMRLPSALLLEIDFERNLRPIPRWNGAGACNAEPWMSGPPPHRKTDAMIRGGSGQSIVPGSSADTNPARAELPR